MSEGQRTLAQTVAEYKPAEGIDDLDTALRLVTYLREKIQQIGAEAEPVEGEHTVFLDAEHERMLLLLYERRKLIAEQENDAYNEEYEFEDVFEDFVSGWIDVAWDMAKDEQGAPPIHRPPTA